MRALGIMTEMSDVLHSSSSEAVEEEWKKIMARNTWLKTERFVQAPLLPWWDFDCVLIKSATMRWERF
jgi:ataxia telangiectasia mutated family protein